MSLLARVCFVVTLFGQQVFADSPADEACRFLDTFGEIFVVDDPRAVPPKRLILKGDCDNLMAIEMAKHTAEIIFAATKISSGYLFAYKSTDSEFGNVMFLLTEDKHIRWRPTPESPPVEVKLSLIKKFFHERKDGFKD